MPKAKPSSFEKDLSRLEEIVAALEEGGLSLDDSLKRFEEGIKLAGRCQKALTEAEQKIEVLTQNAEGELEAKPFGDEAAPSVEKTRKGAVAEAKAQEGPEVFSDGAPLPPEPDEDLEEGELLF